MSPRAALWTIGSTGLGRSKALVCVRAAALVVRGPGLPISPRPFGADRLVLTAVSSDR